MQAARTLGHRVEYLWRGGKFIELLDQPLVPQRHTCCPDGGCRAGSSYRAPLSLEVDRQVKGDRRHVGHLPVITVRILVIDPTRVLPARVRKDLAVAAATPPLILTAER